MKYSARGCAAVPCRLEPTHCDLLERYGPAIACGAVIWIATQVTSVFVHLRRRVVSPTLISSEHRWAGGPINGWAPHPERSVPGRGSFRLGAVVRRERVSPNSARAVGATTFPLTIACHGAYPGLLHARRMGHFCSIGAPVVAGRLPRIDCRLGPSILRNAIAAAAISARRSRQAPQRRCLRCNAWRRAR